ncbi:MAG: response regulator [Candidatus Gastranaerophilales bacterium]|nr:response regulator [Candidatus Gastranaerophilales bacterium]
MSNIVITKEQFENLVKMSGIEAESDCATEEIISKALIEIERKLNFFSYPVSFFTAENLHVLIVDDMELSIYQLTSMLKKIGTDVCVARTKEEAVSELKKKHFDYVVVDLFLPDSKDGFELISIANSIRSTQNKDFKILVVSGTDDATMIQECYNAGIDEFIAKQPNWHQDIMKFISDTVVKATSEEYQKYYINDDICVLTIHKINNETYIANILKEVNANVLTGKPNIILDMEHIKIFSDKFATVFAQVYKTASQAGGNFVIVKPSNDILNALQYVFLNNIIKTFYTIEDAVKYIDQLR